MGKSVFLLPSKNASFNRAQVRRLREQLGAGLALEGPFSTNTPAFDNLVDHVHSRLKFGDDGLRKSVLFSLMPRNVHSEGKSWLRVPFCLAQKNPTFNDECTAGEISARKTDTHGEQKVIHADAEELTLLAVALLRAQDIPCYYAVHHHENGMVEKIFDKITDGTIPNGLPIIIVPDSKTTILTLYPPYEYPIAESIESMYFEVLSEDALMSFLKLKKASMQTRKLIENFANGEREFPGEEQVRAQQIGHTLYEGKILWTPDEADSSIEVANSIFNTRRELQSLRHKAESEHESWITCQFHHSLEAVLEIAGVEAIRNLRQILERTSSIQEFMEVFQENVSQKAVQRFVEYNKIAMKILDHIHDPDQCAKSAS
jgi:hypothetical protein